MADLGLLRDKGFWHHAVTCFQLIGKTVKIIVSLLGDNFHIQFTKFAFSDKYF